MIKKIWRKFVTQTFWRIRMGALGRRSIIYRPMMLVGAKNIFIGDDSVIRDFSRVQIIDRPKLGWSAKLKIGNNVNIEQGVHIVCQCNVTIEDNVSITPYCAIVDTYHPHDPPDRDPKIGDRLPAEKTFVHIGAGTFIGMKTVILPNVRIGKGCVIGAGSVIDKDIPDYSMAAGSPVHIVSVFNTETREWL